MFPVWRGHKQVNKHLFYSFSGRLDYRKSSYFFVCIFVRTCQIAFDDHNRRQKRMLFGMFEQLGEHYIYIHTIYIYICHDTD